MKVLIGTSGYSYKHWAEGVFYPQGLSQARWFTFYAQQFDTVELNVTFYRLPKITVFENWRQKAPQNFRFSVKGSRYITHIKRLKDVKEPLARLAQRIRPLAEQIDCVLWQLPPSMKDSQQRLSAFCLALMKDSVFCGMKQVFEFRNETWFQRRTYKILQEHGFCLCFADSGSQMGAEVLTGDYIYLRFHGRGARYGSEYSDEELRQWAGKVRDWKARIKCVYAYFNNDAYGFAPRNARRFRELLKDEES